MASPASPIELFAGVYVAFTSDGRLILSQDGITWAVSKLSRKAGREAWYDGTHHIRTDDGVEYQYVPPTGRWERVTPLP